MKSNSNRYRCTYSSCAFSSESYFNLGCHELKCRQKKKHFADRSGKRVERIRSDYGSQLLGLEEGPSDTVCQKGCLSPAVKAPTYVQLKDECVLERIPSFLIESADGFLRALRHGVWWIASELVDFLTDTSFEINILNGISKTLQTATISTKEGHVRSWRMMDYIECRWESLVPWRTVTIHYTWRTWLRRLEGRLNVAEKRT